MYKTCSYISFICLQIFVGKFLLMNSSRNCSIKIEGKKNNHKVFRKSYHCIKQTCSIEILREKNYYKVFRKTCHCIKLCWITIYINKKKLVKSTQLKGNYSSIN